MFNLTIMSAAAILRQLVGTIFETDPKRVKISGKIPHTFTPQENKGHSWAPVKECYHTIWGFHSIRKDLAMISGPHRGERAGDRIRRNTHLLVREYYFSDNGTETWKPGESISSLSNYEEFVFFIVRTVEHSFPSEWEREERVYFTVYKA